MATTTLHLRIEEGDLQKFRDAAKDRYDRDPNDLLRELIIACAEGRVKIRPTAGQQALFAELYDEPNPEEDKK